MSDRGDDRNGMGPLEHRLFVCGLHKGIVEDEIEDEMRRYGRVLDLRVRSSPKDTFCFVQFDSERALQRAIDAFREPTAGSPLGDHVKVAPATEDKKRQGGGDKWSDDRDGGRNDRWWGGRGDWRDGGDRGRERRPPPRGGGAPELPPRPPTPVRDWRRGGDDRRGGGERWGRGRSRSLPREAPSSRIRPGSSVPQGQHKIKIENLPDDMTWIELKEIGREFGGNSLTFARTFWGRNSNMGIVEFSDRRDSDRLRRELDGRRIQGCSERLVAYVGGDGGRSQTAGFR